MPDLIKTAFKISQDVNAALSKQQFDEDFSANEICDKNYLVLPDGLDELEEMLKEDNMMSMRRDDIKRIFARFKKEQGLMEEKPSTE